MLTTLETKINKAGWVRCTNDGCFGLPGTGWYPAWSGERKPIYPLEVRAIGEMIEVRDGSDIAAQPVASFTDVSDLKDWCHKHGRSSNEMPAYNGPWD